MGMQGMTVYVFLVLLMGLDVVAGLLKAIKKKALQSGAIRDGLLKKSGTFLALILSYVLDQLVNNASPIFQTMMVIMAVCDESLSIVENLSFLGVPFPKGIVSRLNNLRDKVSETDTDSQNDSERKNRNNAGL